MNQLGIQCSNCFHYALQAGTVYMPKLQKCILKLQAKQSCHYRGKLTLEIAAWLDRRCKLERQQSWGVPSGSRWSVPTLHTLHIQSHKLTWWQQVSVQHNGKPRSGSSVLIATILRSWNYLLRLDIPLSAELWSSSYKRFQLRKVAWLQHILMFWRFL